MKPPQSQFTLGELMGLVALCAVGFALPTIWLAFLGAGPLLVVVPGFVIERARGGTGIIGGIVSGCLIPMGLASLWAAVEYVLRKPADRRDPRFLPGTLPALRRLPGVVEPGERRSLPRGPAIARAAEIEPASDGGHRRRNPIPAG